MKNTLQTQPKIECQKCAGTGKILLDGTLFDTLLVVRRMGDITAPMLQKQMDKAGLLSPTAFNNRLEDLRKLGLLNRWREGRELHYSIN